MIYQPPDISQGDREIAKKFFKHANTVADTRNYDYAIELFLQGLAKDPQAVELGYKPLREVSIKRTLSGGKKAGFLETFKRSSSNKKAPIQSLLNALYLFSKDPLNIGLVEGVVKNMDQAQLPEAMGWALMVFLDLARQDKKPTAGRFQTIKNYGDKLGDHYNQVDQVDLATQYYQLALNALETGLQSNLGQNQDFMGQQRDLAGKLAILKGKYERGDDFRGSIRNAESQKDLQDQGRMVKGESLLEQMIEKARQDFQANQDVAGKINKLVDLLLQRGRPQDEEEALSVLKGVYERTKQYAFKLRADDVRIRQQTRKVKELVEKYTSQPNPELKAQAADAQKELDELEIAVYQERISQYPTDLKMKFELGRRLYKAKRYDEAIPPFQEATGDARYSIRAKYFIGTCFFQKGWNQQAIDVLNEAISQYEQPGDNLSKEMHYVLGRACESAGQKDLALKVYNKLVQWDFNYRDVKMHIDQLQKES